jgi:hypothetical protein
LEVWQNLALFGGRPINGTVEVLLTKVINQRSSVLPIVVFFVDPRRAAVSMIWQHNNTITIKWRLRVSYSQLSAGGDETIMLSAQAESIKLSAR